MATASAIVIMRCSCATAIAGAAWAAGARNKNGARRRRFLSWMSRRLLQGLVARSDVVVQADADRMVSVFIDRGAREV